MQDLQEQVNLLTEARDQVMTSLKALKKQNAEQTTESNKEADDKMAKLNERIEEVNDLEIFSLK